MDLLRGGEPRLMPWQVVSAVHDIINPMILPSALWLLARKAGGLFIWHSAQKPAALNPDQPLS
jgi:hypothetical protein